MRAGGTRTRHHHSCPKRDHQVSTFAALDDIHPPPPKCAVQRSHVSRSAERRADPFVFDASPMAGHWQRPSRGSPMAMHNVRRGTHSQASYAHAPRSRLPHLLAYSTALGSNCSALVYALTAAHGLPSISAWFASSRHWLQVQGLAVNPRSPPNSSTPPCGGLAVGRPRLMGEMAVGQGVGSSREACPSQAGPALRERIREGNLGEAPPSSFRST
jgi:hypothetical protein